MTDLSGKAIIYERVPLNVMSNDINDINTNPVSASTLICHRLIRLISQCYFEEQIYRRLH